MYPTKVSLKDFLGGHEIRYESIHKDMYYRCLYKIDGKKRKAKICFETGVIMVDNHIVRRCVV